MPTGVLDSGIEFLLAFQRSGEWLIGLMNFFTFLGNEDFYFLFMPIVLWCVNVEVGVRLAVYLVSTNVLNNFFKLILHGPRPYWYDPRVRLLTAGEASFGIPSGHAQSAVVLWGAIANTIKKPWAWALAAIIIFMIGASRVYLGVHFPTDVIFGWLIGLVLLFALMFLERPFLNWYTRYDDQKKIWIIFGISILMVAIAAIIRMISMAAFTVPENWMLAASVFDPEHPIAPYSLSGMLTVSGTLFGAIAGLIIFNQKGWMDAGGPIWQRALRFIVGVIGVLIFWEGLGFLFGMLAGGETLPGYILRYIRYSLVGAWIAWWGPLVFIKLGLAQRKNRQI